MSLELRRKVKTRRYYMGRDQCEQLGFETMEPNETTLNGEGKEIEAGKEMRLFWTGL